MSLGKESEFHENFIKGQFHENFIKIAAAVTFLWLRFESGARSGG
jgi:hypothetical protein